MKETDWAGKNFIDVLTVYRQTDVVARLTPAQPTGICPSGHDDQFNFTGETSNRFNAKSFC